VKLGSLNLRAEHKLRMFEILVLRKIYGCKREEVRGVWKKSHDDELNGL
jgi:hypothetical protein